LSYARKGTKLVKRDGWRTLPRRPSNGDPRTATCPGSVRSDLMQKRLCPVEGRTTIAPETHSMAYRLNHYLVGLLCSYLERHVLSCRLGSMSLDRTSSRSVAARSDRSQRSDCFGNTSFEQPLRHNTPYQPYAKPCTFPHKVGVQEHPQLLDYEYRTQALEIAT
jgi:hypothetical protein